MVHKKGQATGIRTKCTNRGSMLSFKNTLGPANQETSKEIIFAISAEIKEDYMNCSRVHALMLAKHCFHSCAGLF